MKRSILSAAVLAWVLTTMSVIVAAPAPAQEAPSEAPGSGAAVAAPPGEDPPDIPYFAYNGDGTVTIDGDVGTSCYDFALTEEGLTRSGDLEQLAQSVVQQCEQAGFLSPDNQYAAYPPAQGQQPPATQAELPTTGGPSLLTPGARLAGGVLLAVLTVLGIVARRRTTS